MIQDNVIREPSPFDLNLNKDYDLLNSIDERFLGHNRANVSNYLNEGNLFNCLDSDLNISALSSNIQSLPSKYESFVNFLAIAESKNCIFDILALQEIWQLRDIFISVPSGKDLKVAVLPFLLNLN